MELLSKIQQALKVPKSQHNKFGGYNYRSCEDILEAVKPLLGKGDLTISDEIVQFGDRYYVKATATLTEGGNTITASAFAREPLAKKGKDESQITGAASSYARKYALNGLFAIDDTRDPDATNKHETNGGASSSPKQSPPKNTGSTSSQTYTGEPPTDEEVHQQAQEAREEIGQRFDKPDKIPAPTKAQRTILNMLMDYFKSKVPEGMKYSKETMIDEIWSKSGHWPSLDDVDFIKANVNPFVKI